MSSRRPALSAQLTVIARVDTLVARLSRRATHEILAARPEWWRDFAGREHPRGADFVIVYRGELSEALPADTPLGQLGRRMAGVAA